MVRAKSIGVLAAASFVAFSTLPAFAHSHCVRAGASATAVTSELATFLAKETLYNSNTFAGRTASGPTSVTCNYIGVVTTCRARQVACK